MASWRKSRGRRLSEVFERSWSGTVVVVVVLHGLHDCGAVAITDATRSMNLRRREHYQVVCW